MKTALGKGLEALLPEKGGSTAEIELRRISADADQPRKIFRDESLAELAASIKEKGVLQPIIVRRSKGGGFTLIAGERRFRAAHLAGLERIPAVVRDSDEEDALEVALIENIQREDLNPVETARAFKKLMDRFGLTQEQLAGKVGKERATVANYLRLLTLAREVMEFLSQGELSMGHARALLGLADPKEQVKAARRIIKEGLSVREAEKLSKGAEKRAAKSKAAPAPEAKDPNTVALENKLTTSLGTRVRISHKGKAGRLEIEYYSLEELDRIVDLLL